MPASLHLSLILCCACLFCAPALAAPSMGELAEALHQKLLNSPESLQWRMPNEAEPVTTEEVGIRPGDCTKPVPARLSPSPRFLLRCVTPQFVGFTVVGIQTLSSWEYQSDQWGPGQIVSIHDVSGTSRSRFSKERNQYETLRYAPASRSFETRWHNGAPRGPYEKMLTYLSAQGLEELTEYWHSLDMPESPSLAELEQWRALSWPSGIVGIDRDGQLLLQAGTVAGAGPLLEKATAPGAIPEFAQGLIRPVRTRMSWEPETPPGTAMYLLRMVRANNTLYAIALSDKLPEDSDDDLQVLSSDPDSDLVFFAVERNL